MSGVSDISSRLSQQFLLQMLRGKVDEAQQQASSGKKSTTMSGLGANGAAQALSLRAQSNLFTAYTDNLSNAKTRFAIMDTAIGSVTDSARDVLSTLRSQLQDTSPKASIISESVKANLSDFVSKLNTQFNGRYVFSGDDLGTAPLNNPAAANSSMATLVSGWLAGTPTAASVASAARGVSGTALGYSSSSLMSGSVTTRGDDSTDIDLTLRAHESGFSDIMRGMAIISNLPQPTNATEQKNYWAVVNGAIKLLDEGAAAVDQTQGVLGARARNVDDLLTQHSQNQAAYETYIGDVEDVDAADAAIKFQSLQTQLQTSYSIIGQLKNLSLVNYL